MPPIRRKKKLPQTVSTVRRSQSYYRWRYSVVQRALSAAWQRGGKRQKWTEFVHSQQAEEIRTTSERECDHQWNEGILEDSYYPNGRPNREDSGNCNNDSPLRETRRDKRKNSDAENLDPAVDGASTSKSARVVQSVPDTMAHTEMDTSPGMDETLREDDGTGSGGRAGARGGGGGVEILGLANSHGTFNFSASYSKSRVWYSYGIAQQFLPMDTPKTLFGYTTPMAFIPVDFLPFYMTEQEYNCLPPNCWVKSVSCNVKVLGVRTAFDIGATVTGTATSEYVPILHTAIGLNNNIHIMNKGYLLDAAKPMVPTATVDIKVTDWTKKWYEDENSGATLIPRSNTVYACPYHNAVEEQASWDSAQKDQVEIHAWGRPRLDKFVRTMALHSAIGQDIISYSYKPKFGIIKMPDPFIAPYHRLNDGCELFVNELHPFTCTYSKSKAAKELVQGDAQNRRPLSSVGQYYYQMIEKFNIYSPKAGTVGGLQGPQPQVHIGMSAIP